MIDIKIHGPNEGKHLFSVELVIETAWYRFLD